MWPFKKPLPPDPVSVDGVEARFSPDTKEWEFAIGGIEFTYGHKQFNQSAIEWGRDALSIIQSLESEMIAQCKDVVRDDSGLMNVDSIELLSVDLSEFESDGFVIVHFCGDDTWGDMGVWASLKDGKIFAIDAGD